MWLPYNDIAHDLVEALVKQFGRRLLETENRLAAIRSGLLLPAY